MRKWEESTTVRAAPETVYRYVSDFDNHPDWSDHGLTVTKVGTEAAGVGTSYETVAKQFGTQRERSTIIEMTPPSRFAWESTGALGRITHWVGIRPDGDGSVVSKGLEIKEPTFLAKMMGWRISRESPKAMSADLAKIKGKLDRA